MAVQIVRKLYVLEIRSYDRWVPTLDWPAYSNLSAATTRCEHLNNTSGARYRVVSYVRAGHVK